MKAPRLLGLIAWRDLWRNPRRTLLTAGTIAGGLALLLVFFGLGDGTHRMMLENAVRLGGAHVAVQARGYHLKKSMDLTLTAGQVAAVSGALDGRAAVAPRVFASGLASSSDGSSSVSLIGVDPATEARVSWLDEKVLAGTFFAPASANAAVIGEGVARKLKLAPGGKCVLMAQGPGSAEIQSVLVRVAGVVRSGVDEIDQSGVLVPLGTAQALLGLPGLVHQAAVFCADPDQAGRAVRLLKASVSGNVEVLGWEDLMPGLRDLIRIDIAGLFIVDTIFFMIIAFLVMNTLLMSVLERRREFALLDAVGFSPARRFTLVMLEAAWIGVLAAASGGLLGYAGHSYFRRHGLNLHLFYESGFSAAGTAIDPVIRSVLTGQRAAAGIGLVFLLTLALAVVPALRAAREADAHLLGQT